ncbi:hypothetical protein TNCV_5086981 [Trichonephila clavipes]|nr:hypothetical protein TNCV_5086981 [Trichonephila clavipes]
MPARTGFTSAHLGLDREDIHDSPLQVSDILKNCHSGPKDIPRGLLVEAPIKPRHKCLSTSLSEATLWLLKNLVIWNHAQITTQLASPLLTSTPKQYETESIDRLNEHQSLYAKYLQSSGLVPSLAKRQHRLRVHDHAHSAIAAKRLLKGKI